MKAVFDRNINRNEYRIYQKALDEFRKYEFIYHGYTGNMEVSLEDKVLHGHLLNIDDLVTYEGNTMQELYDAFIDTVNDYHILCKQIGKDKL